MTAAHSPRPVAAAPWPHHSLHASSSSSHLRQLPPTTSIARWLSTRVSICNRGLTGKRQWQIRSRVRSRSTTMLLMASQVLWISTRLSHLNRKLLVVVEAGARLLRMHSHWRVPGLDNSIIQVSTWAARPGWIKTRLEHSIWKSKWKIRGLNSRMLAILTIWAPRRLLIRRIQRLLEVQQKKNPSIS